MSDEIFLVGNSWSIPCDEAPIPAFNILGLKNRWEIPGITLDAQAEYIIDNNLVNKFKVIWLVGHHHRVDPKGDGSYLLPYPWGVMDKYGDLVRDLWFKKLTKMPWYNRINALFVKAVLGDANKDNLLLIPIYRPNTLEHIWFTGHPCIWDFYLRDFAKREGNMGHQGHMNQDGHIKLAPILASEIYKRWKITLTISGSTQLRSDLMKLSPDKRPI
tara:strand:- start:2305 stop:2952 length:648 start_codon:yes stop_codon:yes gene_type:complete